MPVIGLTTPGRRSGREARRLGAFSAQFGASCLAVGIRQGFGDCLYWFVPPNPYTVELSPSAGLDRRMADQGWRFLFTLSETFPTPRLIGTIPTPVCRWRRSAVAERILDRPAPNGTPERAAPGVRGHVHESVVMVKSSW